MWTNLVWLSAAGMAGTLSRYGTNLLAKRLMGADYPWGTLAVNAVGCLLIGAVWEVVEVKRWIGEPASLAILVGFLGAFTTFSSYAFETVQMLQSGRWAAAVGYVLLQNVLGLALVWVGIQSVQRL